MTTEHKLIEQTETFLRIWDDWMIDDFIIELTARSDFLKSQGAIDIVVELERVYEDGDDNTYFNIKYKRYETNGERLTRIHQEQLNMREIHRQRRENQLHELKERFMDGIISAAEYERRKAAIHQD